MGYRWARDTEIRLARFYAREGFPESVAFSFREIHRYSKNLGEKNPLSQEERSRIFRESKENESLRNFGNFIGSYGILSENPEVLAESF